MLLRSCYLKKINIQYSEYMCVIGPVCGIWCHHLVRQLIVFLSKSVSQTKVAAEGEIHFQPRGLLLFIVPLRNAKIRLGFAMLELSDELNEDDFNSICSYV